MTVKAVSLRGTATTYSYSLSGISAALQADRKLQVSLPEPFELAIGRSCAGLCAFAMAIS